MESVTELMDMICASLLSKPCTEEELFNRDFLKNRSRYGISKLLQMLETSSKIYYKGDVLHVYKAVKEKLIKKGYYD